ncbi:MAG: lycopene cyclase domain-containing protein [Calditrichia bacterium]
MKYEYLVFNLIVISGPLALSFDRRVYFYSKWKQAISAILITLVPFVIWDALVTHSHWWFNENYTLDFRLAQLPLGEWLFFITVPYACLFTWEVLRCYELGARPFYESLSKPMIALLLPGLWLLSIGKEYTGLVLIALAAAALLDIMLKTNIWRTQQTPLFLAICTVFMLIFNGYLTARPVVLYGTEYQLDFRIITIPIEDFGYGFALLLTNIILFEKFRRVKHV